MSKRKTTKEFIKQAKKIHGNKYNYSLVEYINNRTKVKIICKKHGTFEQEPKSHLSGSGCFLCNGSKKKTTKEFIKQAKEIHGNKYDYSLVEYKNTHKKIKIICKKHGIFEQEPIKHLNSSGCPKCANNIKYTNNDFIKKAKRIHGNKYDYSLVKYENAHIKVKIICNKCNNIFEQTPNSHLSGYGCSKCQKYNNSNTNDFIKKAKEIHGNKYDYSLVEYKNAHIKVKIICNKCNNVFEQTPNSHLSGYGCSKCRNSKGELKIEIILKKKNIFFETQKKFNKCKLQKELPFDFYLPNYNLCIEYDGEQHFKPIKYFGGEKKFKLQQKRDLIKNIYCKENNIKLLRIKYNDNIEEKLNEYFEKIV